MKNGAKRPAPAESRKARPFLNRSEGPAFFPAPGVGKASFFPPLQRKEAAAGPAGDDHDLQSRLLAGDAVLEACYDGEKAAYLRTGRSGDAVARVQQALEDLGYPLPKYGVDGIFGAETRGAVRQFQKAHALQVDGVVGPQTIGRLDHLHADAFNPAPEPAPEEPAPEDPGACPDTCEVEPLNLTGFPIQRTPAGPAPPAIQAKHVSMEEAMANFTEKVNPEGEGVTVTGYGQFFWSSLILTKIKEKIRLVKSLLSPEMTKDFIELLKAIHAEDKEKISVYAAKLSIKLGKSSHEELRDLESIVRESHKSVSVKELWEFYGKNGAFHSEFEEQVNVYDFQRIRKAEQNACWITVEQVIKRFQRQMKVDSEKKREPKKKIKNQNIHKGAVRHYVDLEVNNWTKGDVVQYGNLSMVIEKMKAALDDGFLIHARVMSGVCVGKGLKKWKKGKKVNIDVEDHSLVIIGYDNDRFLFWDPSVPSSTFDGNTGFGILYYRDGRLSTARSEADLLVDVFGDHRNGDRRYQVLRIWTV